MRTCDGSEDVPFTKICHWQQIYRQKFIEQKIDYIHNNPVTAGIVNKPEDYIYSSARNYANLDYILEVTKLDFLWKVV